MSAGEIAGLIAAIALAVLVLLVAIPLLKLGHGKSYVYPHDHPDGIVPQQYAPDALVGRDYYRPTPRGAEAQIGARLAKLRAIIRRKG